MSKKRKARVRTDRGRGKRGFNVQTGRNYTRATKWLPMESAEEVVVQQAIETLPKSESQRATKQQNDLMNALQKAQEDTTQGASDNG